MASPGVGFGESKFHFDDQCEGKDERYKIPERIRFGSFSPQSTRDEEDPSMKLWYLAGSKKVFRIYDITYPILKPLENYRVSKNGPNDFHLVGEQQRPETKDVENSFIPTAWKQDVDHKLHTSKAKRFFLPDEYSSFLSSPTSRIYPRGIVNRKNFCFMNCILQPLVFYSPFYNYFKGLCLELAFGCSSIAPVVDSILSFVDKFDSINTGSELPTNKGGSISSEPIYEAIISKRRNKTTRGIQEDAEEFLGFLICDINEELRALRSKYVHTNIRDSHRVDEEGFTEVRKLQVKSNNYESFVEYLFCGELYHNMNSKDGQEISKKESFTSLKLDIISNKINSIQDSLRELSEPENISCGSTRAIRRTFFQRLPHCLVLHLKRFVYKDGNTIKIKKFIVYPSVLYISENQCNSSKYKGIKYSLMAVIYHHGEFTVDGHYTCQVRCNNNKWVTFDDESTNETNIGDVLAAKHGRQAYMLFYERLK